MQQNRPPVPTPGRRRSPPPSSSSPAAAAAARPPHDPPSSPAVQPMSTACSNDDDNDYDSSSSSCCRLLPLDVIRSILAKLPVRSILRFRSVSKSWNQLISEPTFAKLQLAEANNKPSRILLLTNHNFDSDPTNKIAMHALAPDEDDREEEPRRLLFERELASNESSTMMLPYDCDGMVLLYSKTDICLCNPTTRETLPLPGFSPGRPLFKDPVQYLGFGLDRLTNLYKVVRFYYHSFEFSDHGATYWEVGLEVFTLGQAFQSWRQIDDPTVCWICPRQDSVSANGSLYWITNNFSLISFHLGDEGLRQLFPPPAAMVYPAHNFPPLIKGDSFIIKGGGGGGGGGQGGAAERLWFVKVNRDDITYDIWELTDERTHSWKSIHRIGFQMLATEPILAIPVLVIRDGRYILLSNQEKLQRYDTLSKEYKTILTIKDDAKEEGEVNCVHGATLLCPSLYRETLVSFKVATTCC